MPRLCPLFLLVLFLAGCSQGGPGPTVASERTFVDGATTVAAAMAVCEGSQSHCTYYLPTLDEGSFQVTSPGENGTLIATWTAGVATPETWNVFVTLADGGTWGFETGTSPLQVPLAPLVPGSYSVRAYPAETYAGPLQATIQWTASYEA